jgi:hypothetical protein
MLVGAGLLRLGPCTRSRDELDLGLGLGLPRDQYDGLGHDAGMGRVESRAERYRDRQPPDLCRRGRRVGGLEKGEEVGMERRTGGRDPRRLRQGQQDPGLHHFQLRIARP